MLKKENLKAYIDELIKEVEEELEEANVTGNVDGYQTPFAFSGKNGSQRRKKTATQLGYTLVDNDVENIDESLITEKQFKGLEGISATTPLTKITKDQKLNIIKAKGNIISFIVPDEYKGKRNFWQVISAGNIKKSSSGNIVMLMGGGPMNSPSFKNINDLIDGVDWKSMEEKRRFNESINEGKLKRPVNRWLELKNDESMHANKKLAVGLKELKYQLSEVEKFFRWYNQIKTMNELSSDTFWKRTHGHIYKIKERLINIAKTIQEIEK
jgi:hypothetical protein